MAEVSHPLHVSTLKVKELKFPIKSQRLIQYIKQQQHNIIQLYTLCKMLTRSRDTNRLKIREWKTILYIW